MSLIKMKNNQPKETKAEHDFRVILDIVKGYDKAGFDKIMDAVEQCWKGYDIIYRTKTRDDKENEDIIKADKMLDYYEGEEK